MGHGDMLPDYVRRAIYGEMSLAEKRAEVDRSMSNFWRESYILRRDDWHKKCEDEAALLYNECSHLPLLDMLRDVQLDDARTFMHEVTSLLQRNSVEALAMLSAASCRHHQLCQVHTHCMCCSSITCLGTYLLTISCLPARRDCMNST